MTYKEIQELNAVEPFCFEDDTQEQWYKFGLSEGAEIGYKQAEQDNAPTWEDIESIISIANDFLNTFDYDKVKAMGREGYYGEILKRWKERKKA